MRRPNHSGRRGSRTVNASCIQTVRTVNTVRVEMSKRAAPPGSLREFPMATVNFAL
jgi:hypothetical protein